VRDDEARLVYRGGEDVVVALLMAQAEQIATLRIEMDELLLGQCLRPAGADGRQRPFGAVDELQALLPLGLQRPCDEPVSGSQPSNVPAPASSAQPPLTRARGPKSAATPADSALAEAPSSTSIRQPNGTDRDRAPGPRKRSHAPSPPHSGRLQYRHSARTLPADQSSRVLWCSSLVGDGVAAQAATSWSTSSL